MHTHRGLAYKARLMVDAHGLRPDDVVLMPAPLAHISGLLNGVLVPGAAGMRTVFMERWDPERALSVIEREHVTRPKIEIDQDSWGYVAGAVLDLQKRGMLVSVPDDWVVMFTPEFAPTGREPVTLMAAMPREHERLAARGQRLISSHEPVFVHLLSGP